MNAIMRILFLGARDSRRRCFFECRRRSVGRCRGRGWCYHSIIELRNVHDRHSSRIGHQGGTNFYACVPFLGCRILSPRWDAVGCSGARGRALTLTARTQILRLLTEFGKSLCQEPTYIFYGRFTVFIDLGSFAVLDSRQPEGTRSVKSVDY